MLLKTSPHSLREKFCPGARIHVAFVISVLIITLCLLILAVVVRRVTTVGLILV